MSDLKKRSKIFVSVKWIVLSILLITLLSAFFLKDRYRISDLKQGPYKVGFKTSKIIDSSRIYPLGQAVGTIPIPASRPIKIYMWYPAKNIKYSEGMFFEEYFSFMFEEVESKSKDKNVRKEILSKYYKFFKTVPEEQLSKIFNGISNSNFNAFPEDDSFPLIIFGQGNGFECPIVHFALCEYLASYGFVVASCPLIGTDSIYPKIDKKDLETQVKDMDFVLAEMKKLKNVDKNKIALIGFDLGGLACMLLQLRNLDVKSMVSLSSGIMYEHNTKLLKEFYDYDPTKLRVPLLHFTNTKDINVYLGFKEDPSLIKMSQSVERYIIRLKNMDYIDYTSLGMLEVIKDTKTGRTEKENHKLNYQIICENTLRFLNSSLKNDFLSKELLLNSRTNADSLIYYSLEYYEARK